MPDGLEMSPIVPRRGDRSTSGGEGVRHGAASVTQNVTEGGNSHATNTMLSSAQGEMVCKVSTKGIIMQSPSSLRSTFILRWRSASHLGPP